MTLRPLCPGCGAALPDGGPTRDCPVHGEVAPWWRAAVVDYPTFVDHLALSRGLPTWVPWPLPPGWRVVDFGCVVEEDGTATATTVTAVGSTPDDGEMTLTVVTEEPGVGLGAHLAGVVHTDPGRATWDQPAAMRVRVDGMTVPLWPVPVPPGDGVTPDRTVLAGEAGGRWLWVVVSPAAAVLGLADRASLGDAALLGPELLAVPFADGTA